MYGCGPYRDNNDDSSSSNFSHMIKNPNNLPILMCCDMNAKSHDTMKYDSEKQERVKDYGFECYERVTKSINDNGLGFDSLYKRALNNREPIWTTWKERLVMHEDDGKENERPLKGGNEIDGETAKHTIDYIFSKGDAWIITHHLDIPDSSKALGKALLPDWHYPSDHFSLAMRLEWKQ